MNNVSNKKSKKLYCCYSLPLCEYLNDNGMEYELVALNPNSKNFCWIYIKTEKLDKLLTKWSANKRTTFYK